MMMESTPNEIGPGSGIMQLPDTVMHHMLRFVTFANLKSFRLVNKYWRQVTTTPLRRSSKQIKLDQFVFDCVTKMGDGQFPVYRLEVQLYANPEKAKVTFPYFFGICAWVKELTLKIDMDINIYDDKSKIRVVPGTFPRDCIYQNLSHLNLRLFEKTPRNHNLEFWKEFTNFVHNILKNSPNLREVNVKYLNYNRYPLPICTVMEDLFPNSNSAGISKLKSIDFQEVSLEKIDLAKWSTLNFRLRKFKIDLSCISSDHNARLAKFLETQTGTLKKFTLNFNRCNFIWSTATFTFPRMEKIEQLRFTSTNAKFSRVTFLGIDYRRLFPSLKKLDLDSDGVDWKDFLGNDSLQPINTVEELIFHSNLRTSAAVVSAARIFPSLKNLEIPAHSFLTEAVYGKMPNLEVLSLIGYRLPFDDVITGLEYDLCKEFQGVLTQPWIQILKTAEGRSMVRLQKLQTLKLSINGFDLICVSRLSFHVFKQMSSLKCLDLNGSASGQGICKYPINEKQMQFLTDLRGLLPNFNVLY